MTVFSCARCKQRVSRDVQKVPMPAPLEERAPGEAFLAPLMARGAYAVHPDTGEFVLNPEDVSKVARHPDRRRLNGCCGLDGLDGPNLVCSTCGAEIATQQSDCWTQQVIVLIPRAVAIPPRRR